MIRKVIKIDEELCNGCGLCANACHEGAIGIVNGKAKLLRDDYCDGLGNCLPACPTGAIAFEEREAAEFNQAEVEKHMDKNAKKPAALKEKENAGSCASGSPTLACGCPSTVARTFDRQVLPEAPVSHQDTDCCAHAPAPENDVSNLRQWPVQIKLVNPNATYFNGAHLLIAADCTAFAHASFNRTFMKNRITLIGCPKLDEGDYAEKFTAILANNNIKSVTVIRMEVPCCGGIVAAATEAIRNCGKMIPWNVVTLATDGSVLED
jgi:ferredoxin